MKFLSFLIREIARLILSKKSNLENYESISYLSIQIKS